MGVKRVFTFCVESFLRRVICFRYKINDLLAATKKTTTKGRQLLDDQFNNYWTRKCVFERRQDLRRLPREFKEIVALFEYFQLRILADTN